MRAVPLTIKEANDFVRQYHRHNDPTVGGKFAIGAMKCGRLVGIAIAGRPVARKIDQKHVLEITRVCSDGTRNVNSFLYTRMKRIAQLMGYEKIITYTLRDESGESLHAIDAQQELTLKAAKWNCKSRPRRDRIDEKYDKIRWNIWENSKRENK